LFLRYAAGKIVFGESLAASLAVSGEQYYNKCWRHAAGYVTSPPLRPGVDTKSSLVDRLAKYVTLLCFFGNRNS
jgi:dihydropyrimidinase